MTPAAPQQTASRWLMALRATQTPMDPGQTRVQFEETLKFCLSHRQHIEFVIIQRFMLNRFCLAWHQPELLDLEITPDDSVPLDTINLPYDGPGCINDPSYLPEVTDRFLRLMRTEHDLPAFGDLSIDAIHREVFGS